MRCDLHVHTVHSGMCSVPVLRRVCRESYTEPLALYERLRARGMGLVTVTDHDSIEAAEALRPFPDFFLSEEVTVTLPSGNEAHIGVYDITEAHHGEIQARRRDAASFFAYLDERQIVSSINHPLSALTGARAEDDFAIFAGNGTMMEVRNGAMPRATNAAAAQFARRLRRIMIAGSDSHALRSAAHAWTEVPAARTKNEFMAGLRAGRGRIGGGHGGYWPLTCEVLSIVGSLLQDRPASLVLTPLLAALPLVLLFNYGRELAFASYWRNRLRDANPGLPIEEAVA